MNSIITNIVGYLAATVGTSMMLPQVVKSYRTREVKDVSFASVILYVLNCALWLVYGVLIAAMPVTITNAIALVIGCFQLALKLKHGK